MSACDEQLLGAYFDGELAPDARQRAEAHLRDCPACARQLAMLSDASRLLRDYPFEDISDRERIRLHQAVDAAIDRPIWRIGASLGLIAASVLIVGLAWLNALSPVSRPVAEAPVAVKSDSWERVAMTLRADWAPTQAEDQVQLADSMVKGLAPGLGEGPTP
jgi:anti-sigma factor RsiW